ncbi:MAG: polysaccharide deacetylase family protein [Hydrogenothermaceae bacterium]
MKVLTYHNIGNPPKEAKLKTLYVKSSKFDRQLKALKMLNYKTPSLNSINFTEKEIVITFDDGYKDFMENALPILKKYNFKAVVFIVVNLVGSYNKWDWEKLNVKKYLMDWKDIEYIHKEGIEIGSHTLTHPFLTKIDRKEAKKEIESSKKILEDRLGVEIKSFCYPYGDYNREIRDLVEESGYRFAFTTESGSFEKKDDPFQIKRITVFGDMILPQFIFKVIK